MIKDLAKYLAENTDLTIGKTLFKANIPDSPANCVVIFDTGGGSPEQELPADHPSAQVLCIGRASEYEKTKARADEIFNLLNRKIEITIGTKDVMFSRAVSNPQSLGLDDKSRWRIVTNFIFQTRES